MVFIEDKIVILKHSLLRRRLEGFGHVAQVGVQVKPALVEVLDVKQLPGLGLRLVEDVLQTRFLVVGHFVTASHWKRYQMEYFQVCLGSLIRS